METFIVRVWVPDRPGALGAVASRVGAVRGDVVAIDILERGAGRAIDELVVELPDRSLVSLLVSEVGQVDGVDVEDVRVSTGPHDPRLDALETALVLVAATEPGDLLAELVARARRGFESEWAVAIDREGGEVRAGEGEPPEPSWLAAYVSGSSSSTVVAAGDGGPPDVASAPLATTSLSLVLGRDGRPFRGRERRQLATLAHIAGLRVAEVDRGYTPASVRATAR